MHFLGTPSYLAKFLAAVTAVLLVGAAAVSLYLRRLDLALACGIVGGWALMMFFEVLRAEMMDDQRKLRDHAARPDPDA